MADLRALITALPDPVILINGAGRIRGVNAPACALTGADVDGWSYITALRQPALLHAVEATLADAHPRSARYLGNDGARATIWQVSVQAAALSDGPCVVLRFHDISALEEASEMRRHFVANVSHELRTPLTSMMGFIETLRGPAKDDVAARERFLAIMDGEAGRMHRLIEDLLSLSRVEDKERIRPRTTVVLNSLIGDVLAAMAPMAAAAGVSFVQDLPDVPVAVLGDAEQLGQVLRNLLENAIKYGVKAGAGTVTLRLGLPEPQPMLRQRGVRLSVIDSGEGIAPHHIPRLSERFYRVDSHRSREVGGTGLGLAIVKHIITRHRGQLRITSVQGEGAEFMVFLPVDDAPMASSGAG